MCLAYPGMAQTQPGQADAHKLDITVVDENGVAVRSALVLLTAASQTASPRRCETDFA
jgi:hypothetical protein